MNQWGTNGGPYPFFPFITNLTDDNDLKERYESYRVFVNSDFVGEKQLVSQNEEGVSAIKSYLDSRGFEDVDIEAEGNEINVSADNEREEDIKRHLSVYLSIR